MHENKSEEGVENTFGDCNIRVDLSFVIYSPTLGGTRKHACSPQWWEADFTGSPGILKSYITALLYRSCLTRRTVAPKLENLNAMWVTGCQGGRGQLGEPNCQKQGGCGHYNRQSQSSSQSPLIHAWPVDSDILKNEMHREPTKFLLNLYKWKSSKWRKV